MSVDLSVYLTQKKLYLKRKLFVGNEDVMPKTNLARLVCGESFIEH